MRISAEQIKENWSELQKTIDENFEGERLEKIKALHEHFQERMTLAPASGRAWYHNAFPGGYVAHVLNIIQWSLSYYELFKAQGMYVDDISKESVVFAAMFHDLGKIGNMEDDYYSPNKDEWRAKKLQEYYNHNPAIHYMTVTDRAIWILNQFGITMTETEYLGVRLADGLYEEANKSYYFEGAEWKAMKTNLPHIIHFADCSAARQEKEAFMLSGESRIDFPKYMKGESKEEELVKNLDVGKLKDLFA
tara:strand:- start:212 stop:958 length:747 start_codon:yes stop_codon:yes gene_type:complete